MSDEDSLDVIEPLARVVEAGGRRLEITPIKVRELPGFLRAVEPIAGLLADSDFIGASIAHFEDLIQLTVIGSRCDADWLGEQTPDVLATLAVAVVEVNSLFFAERVVPTIVEALQRANDPGGTVAALMGVLSDTGGPTSFTGSSARDTASPM